MLTNEDVKKLSVLLATKDDIEDLKQEIDGLKESVQALILSIDGVLKRLETLTTEFLSITNKVNRLEEWIKILADKTGIKLPT